LAADGFCKLANFGVQLNIHAMVATLSPRSRAEVQKEVEAIRKFGKEICKSKKTARAFLLKHGFITKDNKLSPQYR